MSLSQYARAGSRQDCVVRPWGVSVPVAGAISVLVPSLAGPTRPLPLDFSLLFSKNTSVKAPPLYIILLSGEADLYGWLGHEISKAYTLCFTPFLAVRLESERESENLL